MVYLGKISKIQQERLELPILIAKGRSRVWRQKQEYLYKVQGTMIQCDP